MMEFEEMQKVWNDQQGETMYAINESALHNRIKSKKKAANRRINIVEISLMTLNSFVSIFLLADAILDNEGFWDYAGAVIMALTVAFLLFFRYRRKKAENNFDRSMLGELDHAIANTRSILQIATMMVYYYLLPVAFFTLGKMIYFGASIEKWLLIIGLYILAFFLVNWERRHCHIPRKEHLEMLKRKLTEE